MNGIDHLRIGEPFRKLHDGDERQVREGFGRLASLGKERGEMGLVEIGPSVSRICIYGLPLGEAARAIWIVCVEPGRSYGKKV